MKLTAEEKAVRAADRKQARKDAKEQAIIDSLKNQKAVRQVTITIEWKKSRMWGFNPYATGRIAYADGTGGMVGPFTCSGTGYDKESTVIADVFNACLAYKLFSVIPGDPPYGMYYYNGDTELTRYTDHSGQVQQYHKIPAYNSGVGTSCYYRIAEFIGGEFKRLASGNSFDVYEYSEVKR